MDFNTRSTTQEAQMTKTQTVLVALISVALTVLLNTFIIMSCWNYLVPAIFSLPQISFFQALVMAVLVNTLSGKATASLTTKKES